ncbi:ABC transporter substrate-binding protein [Shewanella sp. NIFS-20-20]|uniref:substrate-binding periplasmic protein n=1 Tax=Shewanella sp. NIFS-20-20 TaxID=2853806 RepID=UPI001C48C00F|nr:transporter substrate-binding domain-containing protein [Shewanella sp. NIFS-20-20]MBV7314318.1 transporter substrate-binding domain-containing protein [Shewanella sp. NIFS-20-20]
MALLSGFVSTVCMAETLRLTSLLWPPYSGQMLAEQGVSVAIVRAALQAEGHTLDVDFYPWSRAKKLALSNTGQYQGYFPAYGFDTDEYIFSNAIGISQLGLATKRLSPVVWRQISDLEQYKLGVVKEYANQNELDRAILSGQQPVVEAGSDEHNLQLLASNRIDAAVIDTRVMEYWLAQASLTPVAHQIQRHAKLLVSRDLHIAFAANSEGEKWRNRVNDGLKKIDTQTIIENYFSAHP